MSSIKKITKKRIKSENLYNLSVQDDESFIANNVVVHNCNSFLTPNFRNAKKNPEITGLVPFITEANQKSINLNE